MSCATPTSAPKRPDFPSASHATQSGPSCRRRAVFGCLKLTTKCRPSDFPFVLAKAAIISAMASLPSVCRTTPFFSYVKGTFFRAVDARYRAEALAGSNRAGRYSSPDQPTLYLSATPDGVEAAMLAHRASRVQDLELIAIEVDAARIFDLRDEAAILTAHLQIKHATAPWQAIVASGERPPSWSVRQRIEELGGLGLIDPSRRVPGLWHLVLFAWNAPGVPHAAVLD